MTTLQKYLQESIFDKNLASEDMGLEYLYGLVDYATVNSYAYIDYLDDKKIKHDFNELSKKFEMKPWNANKWLAMDRIQKMESEELLRELLYIIVTKVKSTDTKNLSKLHKSIVGVIENYAELNKENTVTLQMSDNFTHIQVWIKFRREHPNGAETLGRIEIQLRSL